MQKFRGLLVRGGAACAAVALSTSVAFATPPENPLEVYTTAANVEGLIVNGGTLLATIVAAAVTVMLAFKVIRIGVRWFRA